MPPCCRQLVAAGGIARDINNPRAFPCADFTLMANPFLDGKEPLATTVITMAERDLFVFVTSDCQVHADEEVAWLQG